MTNDPARPLIRILHVDDNPHDIALVADALEGDTGQSRMLVTAVSSFDELDRVLAEGTFDLILTDFNILGFSGFDVVEQVRERAGEVPVILLTGTGSEEIAVEALRRDVDDYVIKTPAHIRQLPHRILSVLERRRLAAEKARAEKALLTSEARYRTVSEIISDYAYAFRVDPDGSLAREWMMGAFERITGYTPKEIEERGGWPSLIHPDDRPIAQRRAQRLLSGQDDVSEFRIVTKSGDVRWLRDHGHPVWDDDQARVVRIYGAAQDITDQMRAQALLQALNRAAAALAQPQTLDEVFDVMAETLKGMGYSCMLFPRDIQQDRLSTRYLSFDRKMLRAAEELVGKRHEDFSIPVADAGAFARAVRERKAVFIDKVEPELRQWLPQFGKRFASQIARMLNVPKAIAAPLVAEGEVIGVLSVQSDMLQAQDTDAVTAFANQVAAAWQRIRYVEQLKAEIRERSEAEARLARLAGEMRDQATQMQGILATVPEGVLLLDADGRVKQANPVAKNDLLHLVGRDVITTREPITRLGDRPLAELLTSPPTKGLWHEVRLKDRVFEVIARPVETTSAGPGSAEAQPEQWVMVINDVTEARATMTQLRQHERLAAVGQLAAGIAHDFNNIMAVIILYASLSLRAPDLSPKLREHLEMISEQGRRAAELIQQILDFSRQSMLKRSLMDLVPFLKEQVKLLRRILPESIQLDLSYGDGEYIVNADPTRIQQAITNLAINARDAMPDGGHLRFELDRVEIEPGQSPLQPEMNPGSWIRLTVTDSGNGIPPDALRHIFEPFFTTKAPGEGSGLGLAQVHGIVSQHEGRISVESQLGSGTTFVIYLPAVSIHSTAPRPQDVSAVPHGNGEVVLIVEDGTAVRAALAATLEQMNYRVLEAANGEEALDVMAEHGSEVALVVSDAVMPVMGGIRLLRALREQGWRTPLILLTGHSMERKLDALQEEGLFAWLPKPPDIGRLAQVMRDALS